MTSTDIAIRHHVNALVMDDSPLHERAPVGSGRWIRMPRSRRLMTDLLHFSRKIPHQALVRHCRVSRVAELRQRCISRPSWSALFMKSYALVAARRPELRRVYMSWPWPHLYEHPYNIARLAVSRQHDGEDWVFFARFVRPEALSLPALQEQLDFVKRAPVRAIPRFRLQASFSRLPMPLRRMAWRATLHLSGYRRVCRLGTFGLTTVAGAGAVSIHPPSLQGTTLTYGPVDTSGHVRVTIVYDHRLLDGRTVAGCLADLEKTLNTTMAEELESYSECRPCAVRSSPNWPSASYESMLDHCTLSA